MDVLELLVGTTWASINLTTFIRMLFFNYLIGATDAHAKNYSPLLGEHGDALLAPLYDVASGLAYQRLRRKGRLAMSIGGENRFGCVWAQALWHALLVAVGRGVLASDSNNMVFWPKRAETRWSTSPYQFLRHWRRRSRRRGACRAWTNSASGSRSRSPQTANRRSGSSSPRRDCAAHVTDCTSQGQD